MHRLFEFLSGKPEQFHLFLHKHRFKLLVGAEVFAFLLLISTWCVRQSGLSVSTGLFSGNLFSIFRKSPDSAGQGEGKDGKQKDLIKWVDFTVPANAMTQAFRYDVATCQQEIHLNWIDLLAVLGAKYGGDFSHYAEADMDKLAEKLKSGVSLDEMTRDMKYFDYYRQVYGAVLDGMVGYYEVEIPEADAPPFARSDAQINEGDPSGGETQPEPPAPSQPQALPPDQAVPPGEVEETQANTTVSGSEPKVWVTKYGLKAFHPLAKNFPYSHYDDFGVSRSYGYRRQHLGHDMMGQTGTPVVAVESGYVEAIGWNQYGGWRLGIRSFDKKRYYYYAHLRKNYPYQGNLKEGSVVTAGDVIGYMGRTGYSATENTNNIDEPHLHFGIQLIFDESQKEGSNEIWIDCYEIIKFLSINRSAALKVGDTKEWTRLYQMKDPAVGSITQ